MTNHTPLPWEGKPHLMDDTHSCNCTSWCEETYAGGVLSINVTNGIQLVSEGGNDAPPIDVAKANAIFVDKAIHSYYPMRTALEIIEKMADEVGDTHIGGIAHQALKCYQSTVQE